MNKQYVSETGVKINVGDIVIAGFAKQILSCKVLKIKYNYKTIRLNPFPENKTFYRKHYLFLLDILLDNDSLMAFNLNKTVWVKENDILALESSEKVNNE